MHQFNTAPPIDEVTRAQTELNHVKDIMVQNVEQILSRGERIELLVDKTDVMAGQATAFRRGARSVRRQMWWKNTKMLALCGFVGLVSTPCSIFNIESQSWSASMTIPHVALTFKLYLCSFPTPEADLALISRFLASLLHLSCPVLRGRPKMRIKVVESRSLCVFRPSTAVIPPFDNCSFLVLSY